jgi:hypothetical protein
MSTAASRGGGGGDSHGDALDVCVVHASFFSFVSARGNVIHVVVGNAGCVEFTRLLVSAFQKGEKVCNG